MSREKKTDNTVTKTDNKPWLFQPGQSGNPKGRPKGSRNKLTQRFFDDMLAEWEEGGVDALRRVREKDPATFLRVAASLVPRNLNIDNGKVTTPFDRSLENMTDQELDNLIKGLAISGKKGTD